MEFRLAKKADSESLAKIHLECGEAQPDGFMSNLGFSFLKTYYSILLEEKNSIVLVAEDENGEVHGFISGSLSAEEHLYTLRKNKLRIAITLIPALIRSPKIFKGLIARKKFLNSRDSYGSFGITKGVRCEYWAWKPSSNNHRLSIPALVAWQNLVFNLGHESIRAEVDLGGNNLIILHKMLGAKVVEELNTQDGRKRVIIEYVNKNKKAKHQNN